MTGSHGERGPPLAVFVSSSFFLPFFFPFCGRRGSVPFFLMRFMYTSLVMLRGASLLVKNKISPRRFLRGLTPLPSGWYRQSNASFRECCGRRTPERVRQMKKSRNGHARGRRTQQWRQRQHLSSRCTCGCAQQKNTAHETTVSASVMSRESVTTSPVQEWVGVAAAVIPSH